MPPKSRITREMIITAAFEIARESGAEQINARTVSRYLNCSTQPVMYHFKTIDALKKAAYQRADEFHSEYLADIRSENPMLDIGLNYIRFAAEEKNLFRFLFQSNRFTEIDLTDLIENEEAVPIITVLSEAAQISTAEAKQIFRSLLLVVHGYASFFANNSMPYDEAAIVNDLELIFNASMIAVKGEN